MLAERVRMIVIALNAVAVSFSQGRNVLIAT